MWNSLSPTTLQSWSLVYTRQSSNPIPLILRMKMILALSQSQPEPYYPPAPQKQFWTVGKIIALVLVAILVVGVSGFATFNYLRNSSLSTSPNTCSNGATNYPTCNNNPCSNGANNPPSCTTYSPCSNGANNPPACTTFNPCSNGATNPPTCNIFPTCPNGATNYPSCTTFRTTTSVTCTPTTIMSHQLVSSSCTVTVAATVGAPPTGTVDFTASYSWFASSCYQGSTAACQLTPLSGGYSSQFILTGVAVQDNRGDLTVYAHYNGDNSHLSSDGQFVLSVASPPATVTVSGTASVSSGNTPYDIQFINASGVGFITTVNSGGSTSGSYSINLPNLETYAITIYYSSIFGTKTCTVGTYLYLQSTTNTLTVNYSC